jgi:putative transposase
VIVLEDLKLKNMTRSARGTLEVPGKNVAAKQGLNRSLQDAALGRLQHWVCVKAEEAGRITWAVPAHNTSRTCASCGHCHVTNRASRDRFVCRACGHTAHADLNAAENIAARGHACETAWRRVGAPPLERAKPRLQRRKAAPSEHEQALAA